MFKIVDVKGAVSAIKDGATVGITGFMGSACPEYLLKGIEDSAAKPEKPVEPEKPLEPVHVEFEGEPTPAEMHASDPVEETEAEQPTEE